MVEPVITNLEIPDHDGENSPTGCGEVLIFLNSEEELEPLDSPPPSYIILCCEWLAMKICGYSPLDKDEVIADTGKKSLKSRS